MVEIRSPGEVSAWLAGKPAEWAQVLAARIALRATPMLGASEPGWLRANALLPIRASTISWAARSVPAHDMTAAAAAAAAAYNVHSNVHSNVAAANAAHATAFSTDATAAARAASFSADSAYDRNGADAVAAVWSNISADCNWLAENSANRSAARVMTRRSLWLGQPPEPRLSEWQELAARLLAIDPGYAVWIDWYERRIRGERAAFDIPGDRYRKEDKAILIRLAEATDKDFWGKGHEHVNATLQGWLDEARERVALEHPPALWLDLDAPDELPTQNRNALSFRTDEQGRIAIDTNALTDRLRKDAGARDRHAEAVSEARIALDRCRGNNAAARLSGMLENYLAAAGDALDGAKPSLLVQRGERLRQELARYEAPDHMLSPVADDLLLDLKGWQSAHNMMVGLDPVLMASDTAMLGPDRRPALIPPEEIRDLANDADAADILAEGTREIVVEAADLAPTIPDPADRRTIWSVESARNLVLEAFAVALGNPKTALTGIVAAGVVLPTVSAAAMVVGVVFSAMPVARFLVSHRQWIEDRMGDTPIWKDLFQRVADRLENAIPPDPKE